MTGKELILLVLTIIVIFLIVWIKPSMPAEKSEQRFMFRVGEIAETNTKIFKFFDDGLVCYVANSETYGHAVSINCLKE